MVMTRKTACRLLLTLRLLATLTVVHPLFMCQKESVEDVSLNDRLCEHCALHGNESKSYQPLSRGISPGVNLLDRNCILSESQYYQHGKVLLTNFDEASPNIDRKRKSESFCEPFDKRFKIGTPMDFLDSLFQNEEGKATYHSRELGIDGFDIPVIDDLSEFLGLQTPLTCKRGKSVDGGGSLNPLVVSMNSLGDIISFQNAREFSEAELESPGELECTPCARPSLPSTASILSSAINPDQDLLDFSSDKPKDLPHFGRPHSNEKMQVGKQLEKDKHMFSSNPDNIHKLSFGHRDLVKDYSVPPGFLGVESSQTQIKRNKTKSLSGNAERIDSHFKAESFKSELEYSKQVNNNEKVLNHISLALPNMKNGEDFGFEEIHHKTPEKSHDIRQNEINYGFNSQESPEAWLNPEFRKVIHARIGKQVSRNVIKIRRWPDELDPPTSIAKYDQNCLKKSNMSLIKVHLSWLMAYQLHWKIMLKLSTYAFDSVSIMETCELYPFTFALVEKLPSLDQWNTIMKLYVMFLSKAINNDVGSIPVTWDLEQRLRFQSALIWLSELILNISDWPFYHYVLDELAKKKNEEKSKRYITRKHTSYSLLIQAFCCERNSSLERYFLMRASDILFKEWSKDYGNGFAKNPMEKASSKFWAGNENRDWETWLQLACSIEHFCSKKLKSVLTRILNIKGYKPCVITPYRSFLEESDFNMLLGPYMKEKKWEILRDNIISKYCCRYTKIYKYSISNEEEEKYFPDRMKDLFR